MESNGIPAGCGRNWSAGSIYDLDELAKRFAKGIQQELREGRIAANLAMKYLVPVARVSAEDCECMAAAFIRLRGGAREAA